MIIADAFPGAMPNGSRSTATAATPIDARCPSAAAVEESSSFARVGTVARGRPPNPYIGAGTIVAMQWIVFGACLLRWAMT